MTAAHECATGVTQLLQRAVAGDEIAADKLLPQVYRQLKAIAERRMAAERQGHTLTATVIVHDAYIRLLGSGTLLIADRAHFFRLAAEAMRRLLIEHARRRNRARRGGGRSRMPVNVADLYGEADEGAVVALDRALQLLEVTDRDAAEVVRLRFYAGLSVEQTAEIRGVSPRTVKREWAFARAWLHRELQEDLR